MAKKKAKPIRDTREVSALADTWVAARCEMSITCGGCSLFTTFDFELGDAPSQVKQDAAEDLYDQGWRCVDSEYYDISQELFCEECIRRGVPEKGAT